MYLSIAAKTRRLGRFSLIAIVAMVIAFSSVIMSPVPAQAAPREIYVDPAAGNDSGSGIVDAPFLTLQKALDVVQPGQTINLAGGVYHEEALTRTPGTQSAPIIIEPVPGALPVLEGITGNEILLIIGHSYYTVRGLEFRNAKVGARIEYATGVIFENNKIHHMGNEGMKLHFLSSYNIVRNNKIWTTGLNGNAEGIYVGTAPEQRLRYLGQPDVCTYNVFSGNEMWDVSEGIDIKEDSSFNTVTGNIVHEARDANSGGIDVRGDSNYFYDNISYNGAGAGFRAGGDITDSPIYGAAYHYGLNNVLRNNIVRNNAGYGYKFMWGPQDADTSNTGEGNAKVMYYYAPGVQPFVTGSPAPPAPPPDVPPADVTPPVISNILTSNIGENSATVTWQTGEPADSTVAYGLNTAYGSAVSDGTLKNAHSLNIIGLQPSTTYHFKVVTGDNAGNIASSADFNFTTAAPPVIPPVPPPAPAPGPTPEPAPGPAPEQAPAPAAQNPAVSGGSGGGGFIGGGGGGGGASTADKRITSLGNSIMPDGTVFGDIEAESLDSALRLTLPRSTKALNRLGAFLNAITVTTLAEKPAPAENELIIGTAYELGPSGAAFNPPVPLTLRYEDAAVPAGMTEASLFIANWDPVKEAWMPVDSTVDTEKNIITAEISHFSIYAVVARATTVVEAAPVPAAPAPAPVLTPVPAPTSAPVLAATPVPEPAPNAAPTPAPVFTSIPAANPGSGLTPVPGTPSAGPDWLLIGGSIAAGIAGIGIVLAAARKRTDK
jgi:hypothetical protein